MPFPSSKSHDWPSINILKSLNLAHQSILCCYDGFSFSFTLCFRRRYILTMFLIITVSGAYNIGIFHWRPTNASIKFAKQWMEMLLADEKIWDQNGFNELMQKSWGPSVSEDSGLVYAFDGSLKLGILPASIFCSGHTYFVQVVFFKIHWLYWWTMKQSFKTADKTSSYL